MSRRDRSDWGEWGEWEYPKPRRPANGIKAQTQRGKFGATWWASRWLAALERLVDVNRLSRGRSYARSGQVTKLDFGPKGVDARVQGSQLRPYRVTIRFRRLTGDQWDAVADAMSGAALYAARLLSGEMPEEIEEAFRTAGVTLFPTASGDLETDCTCPDWANPCKHVAAVFYLLGERFDADPFLMFELRGRTKAEIVAALRARRAGGAPSPPAEAAPDAEATEAAEDADEAVPLLAARPPGASAGAPLPDFPDPALAFWSAPADVATAPLGFRPPPVDALPVKRLGAPPFWQEWPDFAAAAERAYRDIGEGAAHLATQGDVPRPTSQVRGGRAAGPPGPVRPT